MKPAGDGDKARPELARRRENRHSTLKSGRTIGEAREHLETANERAAARKKDKQKTATRITSVSLIFLIVIAILIVIAVNIFGGKKSELTTTPAAQTTVDASVQPTIEIVDEDASATAGHITSRMNEYIALAEADFKELNYQPVKAVLPSGAIREVDFYLDGHPGYIKMVIDRDPAVSVEDADRMFRYLSEQGIDTFEYIDVRIDGKAYWK